MIASTIFKGVFWGFLLGVGFYYFTYGARRIAMRRPHYQADALMWQWWWPGAYMVGYTVLRTLLEEARGRPIQARDDVDFLWVCGFILLGSWTADRLTAYLKSRRGSKGQP